MKKKKIAVLFPAYDDAGWMGGVYYIRNIVNQFVAYARTCEEIDYQAYVLLSDKVRDVFSFEEEDEHIHLLTKKKYPWSEGAGFFNRNMREIEMRARLICHGIDYIYPSFCERGINRRKTIAWIPDFQHVVYPEFFSKDECAFRDEYYGTIAAKHNKLVLSSNDAYDTYAQLYPKYLDNVYVVPFASAIEKSMISGDVETVKAKYGLQNKDYFIVCNQFYRHKNHKLVFETMKKLVAEGHDDIAVVCTGLQKDVKDPSFYPEIEQMLKESNLQENVHILGLIERKDQLLLMKESIAVVQPSYFEGWGTCTEDGKTLGKIVVLSDIPVHRQQADDRAIIVGKDDVDGLKNTMLSLWNEYKGKKKVEGYNISAAVEYGKMFAEMLR
ncbi:MAG: glycosyltransferase [Lachnospiraceae bacterium]|nr:glycosyltransferase [Candidatus Colinaster equi]